MGRRLHEGSYTLTSQALRGGNPAPRPKAYWLGRGCPGAGMSFGVRHGGSDKGFCAGLVGIPRANAPLPLPFRAPPVRGSTAPAGTQQSHLPDATPDLFLSPASRPDTPFPPHSFLSLAPAAPGRQKALKTPLLLPTLWSLEFLLS